MKSNKRAEMIKNTPDIWKNKIPVPQEDANKYTRGHLVVLGGNEMTGAARLVSEAAMRIGCGVCTIVSSADVKNIYLMGAPHVMFESYKDLAEFPAHFRDKRRNACVIGPGVGRKNDAVMRQVVLDVLLTQKSVVLDADALNVFEGFGEILLPALNEHSILTPHEGEFGRLFPDLLGSKIERVQQAAEKTGSCVLLKGKETIICAPSGETIINDHASPYLATAGSGDVLAGMIGGFVAQGMLPLMACSAAVWMHGEAALKFGPGLVATDISEMIPCILKNLQ